MSWIKDWGALAAVVSGLIAGTFFISGLNSEVSNLNTDKVPALKNRVDTLQNTVSNLGQVDANLNTTVATLQGTTIPELKSRLDKMEGTVSNQDYEEKKRQLTALIEKMKALAKETALKAMPLGAIVCSSLEPKQFITEAMLGVWVPADGRIKPSGSNYPGNNVPDLRGVFVRGWNEFSSDKGIRNDEFKDPGPRDQDGYQQDSTKRPNNPFITDDEPAINLDHSLAIQHPQGGTFAKGGAPPYHTVTIKVPKHSHRVNSGGDPETRPKNLALYYYVKVK